jgi:hypothetical protein
VQSSGFTLQEVPNTKFKENELGDFQEMLKRPLFFAGRRPIVLEEGENAETVIRFACSFRFLFFVRTRLCQQYFI